MSYIRNNEWLDLSYWGESYQQSTEGSVFEPQFLGLAEMCYAGYSVQVGVLSREVSG